MTARPFLPLRSSAVTRNAPSTPGAGLAVILLGLAVLATEYDWAARLFAGLRQRTSRMASPLADRLRVRRQTAETS
jgi:hypothetical protein